MSHPDHQRNTPDAAEQARQTIERLLKQAGNPVNMPELQASQDGARNDLADAARRFDGNRGDLGADFLAQLRRGKPSVDAMPDGKSSFDPMAGETSSGNLGADFLAQLRRGKPSVESIATQPGKLDAAATNSPESSEASKFTTAEAAIGTDTIQHLDKNRGIHVQGNNLRVDAGKCVWIDGQKVDASAFTFDNKTADVKCMTWRDMAGTVDFTVIDKDGTRQEVRMSSDPNTSPTGNPAPKAKPAPAQQPAMAQNAPEGQPKPTEQAQSPVDRPGEAPVRMADAMIGPDVVRQLDRRGLDVKGNSLKIDPQYQVTIDGKSEAGRNFVFDNKTADIKVAAYRDMAQTTVLTVIDDDGSRQTLTASLPNGGVGAMV